MLKSKKNNQFKRFLKFNKWYQKIGGRNLTPEDIENTYTKFKSNKKKS